MKKLVFVVLLIPILIFDYGCKECSTEPCDKDTTTAIAKKPILYIYPQETLELDIALDFPNGGKILESIPEYKNLWKVQVQPNGKINNQFDYIYYECKFPDLTQRKFGWVVPKSNIENFFVSNLSQSGFSKKEINDFIEYWVPLLTNFEYYEIYPQYKKKINEMVKVIFSKEPDNFYKLLYVIKGTNNNKIKLKEPVIESAIRKGYFAVEWGVILK